MEEIGTYCQWLFNFVQLQRIKLTVGTITHQIVIFHHFLRGRRRRLQASVQQALDAVYKQFGSLQVLVNNAGVAVDKPSIEVTPEEWDFVMNTNLKGAWLVSQATV